MLSVEFYAASHIGRVRKSNEDNYLVLELKSSKMLTADNGMDELRFCSGSFSIEEETDGVILAVSDGMGGALAGEVASKMAVETIGKEILKMSKSSSHEGMPLIGKLFEATFRANTLIHQEQRKNPEYRGMGATLTGVSISLDDVSFVQVGDSRAYLIRNDKIQQLTKDQSLVQQLVDAKQITLEDAENHIMRNVILQALGAQSDIRPEGVRLVAARGDILLICSDGLSSKLRSSDLHRITLDSIENLEKACYNLVDEANKRGGEDNITVILARLSGSALSELTEEEIEKESIEIEYLSIHDTAEENIES
ncbi:MAG: protein phosphatase 2C domain-containing protein [Pyrinomonadaceae bacterium]|nr:protein phosphatase 2C domain-containing protein [Pyrinomonadaceae bacterium]MCX7640530.1 protein phosphatase 2C domain-containing protein [Pyrinomonadaceae bacterium]MDW8303889.1 protein phosphatase 2C domain-containing protein [Acidobacteriota bacterium]